MRLPFSLRARVGRPFAGLMAAALLPLAGCDESPAATPVPTQIQVSPGSVTLVGTGTEQLFAATVLDQSGTPILFELTADVGNLHVLRGFFLETTGVGTFSVVFVFTLAVDLQSWTKDNV